MSKIYANPFYWGQPVSGKHYVERPHEQDHIQTAIEKQLQLIITGGRGSGKTSLVKHVLAQSSVPSCYLDLTFIVSRGDLISLLLKHVVSAFPGNRVEKAVEALKDQETAEALEATLVLWYDLVKESSKKFTMVWDASHYLMKLKSDVIGELRTILPSKRGITHIFVSHREDVLRDIFDDHLNPFFYHREMLYVKGIQTSDFERYLRSGFRRMGLSDFDLPGQVLEFTDCHPQRTQSVAYAIAQLWLEGTTSRLLERAIEKLLEERTTFYTSDWDEFGLNERRLLIGLAEGYSHPTELGFIKKFQLSATSTAHNTVLKLLREGWIINRDEGYHILDPLFKKWLLEQRSVL